mgnify:CR=1 FL=1
MLGKNLVLLIDTRTGDIFYTAYESYGTYLYRLKASAVSKGKLIRIQFSIAY